MEFLSSINIPGLAFFNRNVDGVMIEEDLQSQELPRQINAVKQVIAFMTLGKDMSMHYNDVANLVATTNIQLKKLVYLYLMQNSRTQPEKAVLQAGTFSHDTNHESPLIRGFALRTMSSMQVGAMVEFLKAPILRCLRDSDPYVRRTAVFASLKLQIIAPQAFTESGVCVALVELLSDPIASVVASVVAVCTELVRNNGPTLVAAALFQKQNTMLAALEDCTEWQQHYLLEGISLLLASNPQAPSSLSLEDAEILVSRVLPLLSSANAAVVSSSSRIVVLFLQQFLPNVNGTLSPMKLAQLEAKFAPRIVQPMMSLCMAARFELRYIAMRHVLLLIQIPRLRDAFAPFVNSFFVKYDDAVYVKLEKLGILSFLVNRNNWEMILAELVEYATEVDVEFVCKAVRCIGLVAIKVESAAGACVEHLVKLIDTKIGHVVQETAVVVQMILRQYHDRFDGIIVALCNALNVLDNAESKAAVAWVVGEFADRVANAPAVLSLFFENLAEESTSVQLAVLTAVMKSYLTCSDVSQVELKKMLEDCLSITTRSQHPDVRDRSFFYWRLLLADTRIAKDVILAAKPPMTDFSLMDKTTLSELLCEYGAVSTVLHTPLRILKGLQSHQDVNMYGEEEGEFVEVAPVTSSLKESSNVLNDTGNDITTIAAASPVVKNSPMTLGSNNHQLTAGRVPGEDANLTFTVVLPTSAGNGVEIAMAWSQHGSLPIVHFRFRLAAKSSTAPGQGNGPTQSASNNSDDASRATMVRILMIQLNVNMFGLGIAQEVPVKELHAGEVVPFSLAVNCNNGKKPVRDVQVAVKVDPLGVLFFNAPPVPPQLLLLPATSGGVDTNAYVAAFKALQPSWSLPPALAGKYVSSAAKLSANTLRLHHITLVHQKEIPTKVGFHLFCETVARQKVYLELTVKDWVVSTMVVRCTDDNISHIMGEHFLEVITR
ncbi:beta adaptin 1, putative [Bodo saltans]|uniref:Beta adaptin 1, putative n=1 Tax=Bodo saltans TaxID=75058 RepID=A0A0S4IS43_BODSA|nr:beta adaptin 1, putative [Bodo saltans]|eukprot:CUE93935.1 beta adaptin 1, putative [Bodo saltans]